MAKEDRNMILEQPVTHNATSYMWTFDSDIRCEQSSWNWRSEVTFMTPPTSVQAILNRTLINVYGRSIVAGVGGSVRKQLFQVFRSMGTSNDELVRIGLRDELEQYCPDEARELRFERLPPAGHTPFNSIELRDWFCSASAVEGIIPSTVKCHGEGPFDNADFVQFLQSRGICTGKANVVILGRRNWSEEEVDEIIDEHVGRTLRIYSQEMFLSFLSSKKDPFYAGRDVLSAFKSGHPGLEFLSRGWPDWVETYVSECWHVAEHSTKSRSNEFGIRVDRSPLKVLGYAVGRSGIEVTKRREILERAYRGDLPITGSQRYMLEWGCPGSPERLRKIAESIASHCRNQKRKQAPSIESIQDWEADLGWLKDQFYHGHVIYHWPDTLV